MIEDLDGRPQFTKKKKPAPEGVAHRYEMSREETGIPFAPTKEEIDTLLDFQKPAVGDPTSNEKGSGARWNAGKVPYDMLPLQFLDDWLARNEGKIVLGVGGPDEVLCHLRSYQAGEDVGLDLALAATIQKDAVGMEAFAEAAKVFQHVTTRPVKPYPKWNWMKGMNWSVPIGCVERHCLARQKGETHDPETGFLHLGHVQCNLIMLLLYRETYKEGDDRPPKEFLP